MTYGVGLLLDEGLVLAVDSRTNAGVDNIATFRKLHCWAKEGERVFVLLSSGNLAVTQAVVSILTEGTQSTRRPAGGQSLFSVETMFQAARVVGHALREVRKTDAEALLQSNESFHASFILGGQVGEERPRLFHIYSAGNFIEATHDTPFLQIGEHKYGKPILDRVAERSMKLGDAAKLALLSFDSTIRSNLTVGLPIDILVYERDALTLGRHRRIGPDDPYFRKLSHDWSRALRLAFGQIEALDI